MSVCNLFRELKKDTGNFLSFSQYADDLTRYYVQHNNYKAIPSKFVVCNVDCKNLDNISIPTKLQNEFENACAYFRTIDGDKYTPDVTRDIFWSVFGDMLGELKEEVRETENDASVKASDKLTYKYFDAIKYIGDIDIQSYEEKDGVGYNEIYCYIPNDARCTRYEVSNKEPIKEPGSVVEYPYDYVMGYGQSDEIEGMLPINGLKGTTYSKLCKYQLYHTDSKTSSVIGLLPHTTTDRKFEFNTVVVLYNIMSKDSNGTESVQYLDIPLGVFFTGTVENGVMTNSITKYVENDDIYGAGTSYGIRICTRFTCTPNATEIKEISVESSSQYAGFVQVMEAYGKSFNETKKLLSDFNTYENSIKQHLSAFKNYRTNIPYTRYINGVPYWFVNGKNTGVELSYQLTEEDKNKIAEQVYNRVLENIDSLITKRLNEIPILTHEDILDVFND